MNLLIALLFPALSMAAPTNVKLALNWKAEPQFGGFYQMSVHQDDVKENLKVELLEGGSGTPTIQMLANGKVDFAVVSAEEILISNDRNPKNPVVALFAVFQTNPQMIMCHADRHFARLEDVYKSKSTLAMQSGLTYAQYLKKKYPQPTAKIVPYLGGVTNYLNDPNFCQQGFATSEPIAAEKAKQPATVFLVASEGFNPYTTVLAVRAETLKTQTALVQKMVKAVKAGWSSYTSNPLPANEVMGKINKAMDAETFQKSAIAQSPLVIRDNATGNLGLMTQERWDTLITQLKDLKVIDGRGMKAADQYKTF